MPNPKGRHLLWGTVTCRETRPCPLAISDETSARGIDFHLANFKKGTWKSYTPFDGLADHNVYSIARTPDGMMWFGTAENACRFDGKEFESLGVRDRLGRCYVQVSHFCNARWHDVVWNKWGTLPV